MKQKEKTKKSKIDIGFIVFLIIFIPILIILLTIIVKAAVYPDKIPDVLGYKPFIVLTDTKTEIRKDDLILTKIVDESQIQIGNIISYTEDNVVETHEVIDIQKENYKTYFVINISANNENEEYKIRVNSEFVEGKYLFRIANLRWNIAMVTKLFHINNSTIINMLNLI